MATTYTTTHQRVELQTGFNEFTKSLESLVGRFDLSVLTRAKTDPEGALKQLKEMTGEQDLILFEIYDHGALLSILGTPREAKQYLIGNALTASTMTKHDIRAGLYAPLRILVSNQDGKTIVEYDLAASSFGQFGNREIDLVARSLDIKMDNLIKRANELATDNSARATIC